ncbi:toxin ParE1/3/4 [Thalassospira sp. MBR-102]|uniref:type II toxin-antitoxin system RelE/ParE family toxin n=1 Tax=Thalassospira sp. MBR-102 TaxID=3156466 RepID=UPI0033939D9A
MAAQYRLTASAKADINALLDESTHRHGQDARNRYAALLLAALRRIAQNPEGGATAARPELHPDMRSFHIRHSRTESNTTPVGNPVHVIFYRTTEPGRVDIIRVLHDRMEPSRHVEPKTNTKKTKGG